MEYGKTFEDILNENNCFNYSENHLWYILDSLLEGMKFLEYNQIPIG